MYKKFLSLFLSLALLLTFLCQPAYTVAYEAEDKASGKEILSHISSDKAHPRLLITKSDAEVQSSAIGADEFKKAAWEELSSRLNWHISDGVFAYVVGSDNKAFGCCLRARERLMDLSMAYLLTNDTKYADRAWTELENVLSGDWYDDTWNMCTTLGSEVYDAHRLDSGKLFVGVAFAYDALCDEYLNTTQKTFVRTQIERYVDDCNRTSFNGGAKYGESNWAAVEGAAMLMMALAFYGDDADFELKLDTKLEHLAGTGFRLLTTIGAKVPSDGSWYEGRAYHEYMLEHITWAAAALTNSCGTDFGLANGSNLLAMCDYSLRSCTKNGMHNFGSTNGGGPSYLNQFAPETMLAAKLCGDENARALYNNYYKSLDITVKYTCRYLMFAPADSSFGIESLPFDSISAESGYSWISGVWDDPDRVNLVVNGNTGSHFDKGSFILDSMGERWFGDPGRPNSWYDSYLYYSWFHNVLVLSKDDGTYFLRRESDSGAYPGEYSASGSEAFVIYDLKDTYCGVLESYKRGFFVGDDRTVLTIRDELTLHTEKDLTWNFMTYADVAVSEDKKSAVLTLNGRTMRITADCSVDGWYFEAPDVDVRVDTVVDSGAAAGAVKDYLKAAGLKILTLNAKGMGDVTMSIRATPKDGNASSYPALTDALADWETKEEDKLYVSEFTLKHSDLSMENELFVETELFGDEEKSIQIIVAHYDGDELKHISNIQADKISAKTKTSFKKIIPSYSDSDTVKFFAFDSMGNLKPLNGGKTLSR